MNVDLWNFRPLLLLILVVICHSADALQCYQCDSWTDKGCSDDSYLEDQHYRECYYRTPVLNFQVYCLKEITTFEVGNTNEKYHRPHVRRSCTTIPSSKAYRQNSFNDDSDDDDECEKRHVVINSITGKRKICSCTTDGCNSADSLSMFLGKHSLAVLSISVALYHGIVSRL